MFMGKEIVWHNSFHGWKIIPLRLIINAFGSSITFHSNMEFKKTHVKSFPHYYRDYKLLLDRKRYFSRKPEVPSCILSQNSWFNQCIQIAKEPVHMVKYFDSNISSFTTLRFE